MPYSVPQPTLCKTRTIKFPSSQGGRDTNNSVLMPSLLLSDLQCAMAVCLCISSACSNATGVPVFPMDTSAPDSPATPIFHVGLTQMALTWITLLLEKKFDFPLKIFGLLIYCVLTSQSLPYINAFWEGEHSQALIFS